MKTRNFLRDGQSIVGEPYRYAECGLDDVYLLNGFKMKETPYGKGVTITDIDGLHRAIGVFLVHERKTLSPKELKFLRKQMGLTQAELGSKIGQSAQQVARWEKGSCEIPGPAERLIRIIYAVDHVPEDTRGPLLDDLLAQLDELTKTDQTSTPKLVLIECDGSWKKAA